MSRAMMVLPLMLWVLLVVGQTSMDFYPHSAWPWASWAVGMIGTAALVGWAFRCRLYD